MVIKASQRKICNKVMLSSSLHLFALPLFYLLTSLFISLPLFSSPYLLWPLFISLLSFHFLAFLCLLIKATKERFVTKLYCLNLSTFLPFLSFHLLTSPFFSFIKLSLPSWTKHWLRDRIKASQRKISFNVILSSPFHLSAFPLYSSPYLSFLLLH